MALNRINIKRAFTLAEVLITLAVIGVVAALAIPSVLKNYNDKKYNTARLKALKTFGEAGKMASINGEINGQPTARAFVENVLSKYLKIVKVCDTAEECDFPSKIQPSNPKESILTSNNLKAWNNIAYNPTINNWTDRTNKTFSTYVLTADGFSAKLFYNPNCMRNSHENPYLKDQKPLCYGNECGIYIIDATCMNVIYDMNGKKSPNHVGEDIGFVTTFWSGLKASSAAPGIIPYDTAKALFNQGAQAHPLASEKCAKAGSKKIVYSLPSVDEISSLAVNLYLIRLPSNSFMSGTPVNQVAGHVWV